MIPVLPPALLGLALAATDDRTLQGVVRTRDSVPIVGATLWLMNDATHDSTIAATSGVDGTYRFTLPVREGTALLVRRRGFRDARTPIGALALAAPAKRPVIVAPVTLEPLAEPLATVVVPETGTFTGPMAPFYRHVAARRGDFVTRTDIDRMKPASVSNLLQMMRGVMLERAGNGTTLVRLRGRGCYASLWMDGLSLGARAFDIDIVSPKVLVGVEVYMNPGTAPMEYQSGDSSCGMIALWTMRGMESSGASFDPPSIADPANVHLATDVEEPVRLAGAGAQSFAPTYPSEARVQGIGGAVTVELVVDTAGTVERASAGVVSTMAPILGDAAVDAVGRLRFTPARIAGRPVRQLVHLVAVFQPAASRRPR